MVTPQDHLHRVTRLLTLAAPLLRSVTPSPSPKGFPPPTTAASTTSSEAFYTPQTSPNASPCAALGNNNASVKEPPASSSQHAAPPRHILIADKLGTGNLLGILNSDRLLAYLRVRMRNLPTPSTLKVSSF